MRLDEPLGGEAWNPPQFTIPPRSRLYRLEPVGAGTAWVESLSSYISRLADAHAVSTGILFGYEVSPLVNKAYMKKERVRSLGQVLARMGGESTAALNGVGANVSDWVQALETLTMRSDLRGLTMSTWREVLTPKSLLRRKRAWCPTCYGVQRASGQVVYDPLMWFIEPVTTCPAHRRRLRTVCGFCHRQFAILTHGTRPGYCPICKQWLGENLSSEIAEHDTLTEAAFDWDEWVITNIGEIIAAAPKLDLIPCKANITLSLEACLKRVSESITALSRMTLVARKTLRCWQLGNRARLDLLLRFCFQNKITLLGFLTGNIPIESAGDSPVSATEAKAPVRRRKVNIDLDNVELILRKALEENPPPSLLKVIQRLEIGYEPVYKNFPDLGRAIRERFSAYQRDSIIKKRLTAQRALEEALNDVARPSRSDVARKIGWRVEVLSRTFPELCRALSERYAEGQKEKWSDVERELNKLLVEWPPLPRREVIKRTGYSRHAINQRFPDLYRRLTARYMDYSKTRHTSSVTT